MKRIRVGIKPILALSLVIVLSTSCSPKPKKKPNVIIIVMDTVTVKHLSVYGFEKNDTTPNLKDFAAHATKYSRAYSTSAWTPPSHGSLFTGLYPTTSGVHRDKNGNTATAGREFVINRVPESAYILPEVLKDNGYVTAGFTANGALIERNGFTQGYDTYFDPFALNDAKTLKPDADQANKHIIEWLENVRQRPFFLFANYMDAHTPRVLRPELGMGNSRYCQAIRFIDIAIGQVFEKLKEMDEYDNSMIFIISDHGEHFGEKGYIGHGKTLYEPLVHVPMLVKMPNQKREKTKNKLVSLVDILPTILHELAIDAPIPVQGQHIEKPRQSVFFEVTVEQDKRGRHTGEYHYMRGLILDKMKLIETEDGIEVYDLEADPEEKTNLYVSDSEILKPLLAELDKYDQSLFKLENSEEQRQLSEEIEESLRALGYIQ